MRVSCHLQLVSFLSPVHFRAIQSQMTFPLDPAPFLVLIRACTRPYDMGISFPFTTLNLGFGRTVIGLSLPLKSGSAGDVSPFLKEVVLDPFKQPRGDRLLLLLVTAGDFLLLEAGVAGDILLLEAGDFLLLDAGVAGDILLLVAGDFLLLEAGVAGDFPVVARRFEGDLCSFTGDSDLLF